jgi:hypothetical protein
MGNCNCKSKKSTLNNISNPDHIQQAKLVYKETIQGNTEYSELDKLVIYQTYAQLYPASSAKPSLEEAINKIKEAIEIYDVRYKR